MDASRHVPSPAEVPSTSPRAAPATATRSSSRSAARRRPLPTSTYVRACGPRRTGRLPQGPALLARLDGALVEVRAQVVVTHDEPHQPAVLRAGRAGHALRAHVGRAQGAPRLGSRLRGRHAAHRPARPEPGGTDGRHLVLHTSGRVGTVDPGRPGPPSRVSAVRRHGTRDDCDRVPSVASRSAVRVMFALVSGNSVAIADAASGGVRSGWPRQTRAPARRRPATFPPEA